MYSSDQKINKLFYSWLLTSFILVFIMVIVGGLTRLTNSGLSITEWELFTGILPPMTQARWDMYFDAYKKIPQYYLLNHNMTIDEFKIIFYWEYFHRILGRIIGLFFLIPLIFFYYTKKIKKNYLQVSLIVFALILLQGFVGWYMVESGLVNEVTVSHYRLSLHLSIAFFIISILFWMLLNFKNYQYFFNNQKRNIFYFYFLIFLLFVQIIIGAFVSGLDAGKIYQTWPLMNYSYFPDDIILKNFKFLLDFNNEALVQFYHRNIAYFIIIYVAGLGFYIFKNNIKKLFKPFYILSIFLIAQVLLGIITLLSGLNIYLASAHQICSIFLILSVINLYYCYIK